MQSTKVNYMYGAQLLQMGGRVERPDMESRMDPAHQPRFEVPYQKKNI
jgi:hypothetical protein